MTTPQSHRPGLKEPSLWDRGMVTGGPGRKPDWKKNDPICQTVIWPQKKWSDLSDSDMATGGLRNIILFFFFVKINVLEKN